MSDAPKQAGYRQPPVSSRFQPGVSGNPRGRPPNRHKHQLPYENVMGQWVTITDIDGAQREVTAEYAFLLKMTASGLSDNSANGVAMLKALDAMQPPAETRDLPTLKRVTWHPVEGANDVLEMLRMAKPLYLGQPNAHMAIEPWLVEAALARLGDQRFSRAEQQTIVAATRTPHKVKWPDWWEVIPPKRR